MAKRRARKATKQPVESHADEVGLDDGEHRAEKKQEAGTDQEVERRISAIKAIRDMEIEHLLMGVGLLRSYFNEEQLQVPVLQFFEKNLPNVSVVRNGEGGQFDLQWKDREGNLPMHNANTRDVQMSLLHCMSIAYPEFSGSVPSYGGLKFSSQTGKTSLCSAKMMSTEEFVLDEPCGTQTLGMQDGLQTPGVNTPRLSIGMTPKTQRLPKHGEMLLSVHGSPLGVYKEDNNMEAIRESDEG